MNEETNNPVKMQTFHSFHTCKLQLDLSASGYTVTMLIILGLELHMDRAVIPPDYSVNFSFDCT